MCCLVAEKSATRQESLKFSRQKGGRETRHPLRDGNGLTAAIATCCGVATSGNVFSTTSGRIGKFIGFRNLLRFSAAVPKDALKIEHIFPHLWGKVSAVRWYNISLPYPSRPRRVSQPQHRKRPLPHRVTTALCTRRAGIYGHDTRARSRVYNFLP